MAERAASLDTLRKDLKRGRRPFYLFTGEQEWILAEAVTLLREGLGVDPATGFEYGRLDNRRRWEDFESPLRNYGFFDGPKLVHLELAEKQALREDLRDALNAFLEETPGPNTLCLTSTALKPLVAARNRLVKNGGLALAFAPLKGRSLEAWAGDALRRRGADFEAEVPARLVDRLPPDPGQLAGEVEKLALASGPGGRITAADVERLVTPQPALDIFRLTDALAAGRAREGLAVLADLLEAGALAPQQLLALLGTTLSNMLRARLLLDAGLSSQAAVQRLGGHPFAARKAVEFARGSSRRQLIAWILNLQKLDLRLRRVQKEEQRRVMETYLLESLAGRILPA